MPPTFFEITFTMSKVKSMNHPFAYRLVQIWNKLSFKISLSTNSISWTENTISASARIVFEVLPHIYNLIYTISTNNRITLFSTLISVMTDIHMYQHVSRKYKYILPQLSLIHYNINFTLHIQSRSILFTIFLVFIISLIYIYYVSLFVVFAIPQVLYISFHFIIYLT